MKALKVVLVLMLLLALILALLFIGRAPKAEDISWGVTFSEKYVRDLGLDWQEAYIEILDGLGARKIRTAVYWDVLEPRRGFYDFSSVDWQLREAGKRGVDVILVIGMKVPRWPECHIPEWAQDLDKEDQQERILEMLEKIVLRYRDRPEIEYWQVENEPFLDFGECPWYDKKFFLKEVEAVRSLDPDTPVMVTESGELSSWFSAGRIGDIVGVTMYRRTWWHRAGGFYFRYPITPIHYYRKAKVIERTFGKEVINVELQAEPWGPVPTYALSLEEQEKSMNIEIFRENIDFAERTGFSTFYLWGVEWWYWMKKEHDRPEFWNEAKKLFDHEKELS